MIKISEIFYSIQGESTYAGLPTVFVRTTGCHLRCSYCDTTYSYHDGSKMSIEQILIKIKSYNSKYICITGGEPLLHEGVYPLMKSICDQGYHVSLETSGDIDCARVEPRVKKIIDIKTPDSGEFGRFNEKNLEFTDVNTEFKFIICSEKDFNWAEEFIELFLKDKPSCVLFSPSFKFTGESWLAERVLKSKYNIRLQLQLHKYIWPDTKRGI